MQKLFAIVTTSKRNTAKRIKEAKMTNRMNELETLIADNASNGWQVLFPLKAEYSKLKCEQLSEVCIPKNWRHIKVKPDTLLVGDMLIKHGFVSKIVSINVIDGVFCIDADYVAGDLSLYKYFISNINNGCDRGHLSYHQGNELANWFKIIEEVK